MNGLRTKRHVTIIIPNRDGSRHLRHCLASIQELTYPSELIDVLIVDNGSGDESVDLAKSFGATVIELSDNKGFAAACNTGARAATSELVAFLNNDMVVDTAWLLEMAALLDADVGIRCVGGGILDWAGEFVDFSGGVINFHGFGDQPQHGAPVSEMASEVRRHEAFACAGSMLIERKLFLDVGGFDESYFAYFEDVDLGWRLNVLGHDIAYAPRSRCLHRHHGTSGRFAPHQRTLLLERNALRSLIKNVDDENLSRFLGPAALLLVARALDASRSSRASYRPFARARATERIPSEALARLHAVGDVLEELPELMQSRSRIQDRRVRDDEEVFARFGALARPIGATSDAYRDAFANVVSLFGVDDTARVARDPSRLGGSRGRMSDLAARHPFLRRIARRD